MSDGPETRGAMAEGCLVGFTIALLAAIAVPNFVAMGYRAKRAGVPGNVDGIKTALLAYHARHGEYPRFGSPPDPSSADKRQHDWPVGTAFDTLGWAPDGKVRGVYWFEVTPDGADFVVLGACDVDGDGERAWYSASRQINAASLTDNSVY